MLLEGKAYNTLIAEAAKKNSPYNDESKSCIHRTLQHLVDSDTSVDRPGMLLGMVQSGKTKTFLGVIALGLDNGFNLFIVLTTDTKALATQTTKRLRQAFFTIIEDDELRVFDVMALPKLTRYEQCRPMVMVAKKQKDNLRNLVNAVCRDYPGLSHRRAIIIDDEADFASIGFRRSQTEFVEAQRIMTMIGELRQRLPNASLLQTTATPYSLYLQPDKIVVSGAEFKPVRPAFTELVPVHEEYIGGKFYFEDSLEPGSVASYLYHPVDLNELDVLHLPDRRRFRSETALTNDGIVSLRQAIVAFLVGGIIRRLQAEQAGERPNRYSFIIHTQYSREAHEWQEQIVEAVVDRLREGAEANLDVFIQLVRAAYDDLARSVNAGGFFLPNYEDVLTKGKEYLLAIQVEKVNSETDINRLLDRDGQLELRNPLNIFIGGQILDRGITVANLIGFYYGRRANRFQQDTVLQHSRMYGARPRADLAVTRFYTSPQIYRVLNTIHDFDTGLRTAFESGGQDAGVIFIQQEGNSIIPCSPNKVLLSTLTAVRSGKRLLPIGFQTGSKSRILRLVERLDADIDALSDAQRSGPPALIDLEEANSILDMIRETLVFEKDSGYEWDLKAVKACLKYVSTQNPMQSENGKVYVLVRTNRENRRMGSDGIRFFDAPDTSYVKGELARSYGVTAAVLMLFRQNGAKEKGWSGCPFWWPVIYMPQNMRTVVFANDTFDTDEGASSDEMPTVGEDGS